MTQSLEWLQELVAAQEIRLVEMSGEFENQIRAQDQRIENVVANIHHRITESERSMTTWVGTQLKVARDLIQLEEDNRRELGGEFRQEITAVNERVRLIEDGPITTIMDVLGDLQSTVGRIQKDLVSVDDTLQHTEHSEDRRRANAKQNAAGEWRIDATVELYGAEAHIVAQELAKVVEECWQAMARPTEGWPVEPEPPDPDNEPSTGFGQTGDITEKAF